MSDGSVALGVAAKGAVGHVEEQPSEDEDNRFSRLDEREAGDDREPAQHERADDPIAITRPRSSGGTAK